MTACDGRKVYDQYVSTPLSGWERSDTVKFGVPPVEQEGSYSLSLNLRTDTRFPFTSITMIVDRKSVPSGLHDVDTLRCELTDRRGRSLGKGINLYQYTFDMTPCRLNAGDSLCVSVSHDMMRETLPGIADVGLTVRQE